LTAYFETDTLITDSFNVVLFASPGYAGSVTGAGRFAVNTPVSINAVAIPNYKFVN